MTLRANCEWVMRNSSFASPNSSLEFATDHDVVEHREHRLRAGRAAAVALDAQLAADEEVACFEARLRAAAVEDGRRRGSSSCP